MYKFLWITKWKLTGWHARQMHLLLRVFPTQYCVLYCSNNTNTIKEMYPRGRSYTGINLHSFTPSLTTMGVAICKKTKCLYFCRDTPLDLHQSPSFSKENEWKLARGICHWCKQTDDNIFLLIIPGHNSSGVCGTSCQPGSSHGYDVTRGSWGIWTKGTEHSESSFAEEVVICWLVVCFWTVQLSYIQLTAKTWVFS